MRALGQSVPASLPHAREHSRRKFFEGVCVRRKKKKKEDEEEK